ncbi:MAG TPA: lysine biosynthesis protein LysW [Candidatus Aminicenantes bacterium]|nr:lysine biosynthesis protein LysW [Candidatus Aminicenantes bacterium]
MTEADRAGHCPVCDAAIVPPRGTAIAELIPCPDCGSELEVTGLEPLAFAQAPREEEDWGQ